MSPNSAATSYPLAWPEGWPRIKGEHRRHWPGGAVRDFDATRKTLFNEFRLLGADGATIVISANVQLRQDGFMRADAARLRISDPGVALYFNLRKRPMSMARDAYGTPAENLRSLTLAIEHLRGLERHGGAHMMERAFAGFGQLPPPTGGQSVQVDWRAELGPLPDGLENADLLLLAEARYRAKARGAHPDAGGSNEAIIRLNAAIADARKDLGA